MLTFGCDDLLSGTGSGRDQKELAPIHHSGGRDKVIVRRTHRLGGSPSSVSHAVPQTPISGPASPIFKRQLQGRLGTAPVRNRSISWRSLIPAGANQGAVHARNGVKPAGTARARNLVHHSICGSRRFAVRLRDRRSSNWRGRTGGYRGARSGGPTGSAAGDSASASQ